MVQRGRKLPVVVVPGFQLAVASHDPMLTAVLLCAIALRRMRCSDRWFSRLLVGSWASEEAGLHHRGPFDPGGSREGFRPRLR